jgi:hypothetical protein
MNWIICLFLNILLVAACVAADEFPPLRIEGVKAGYSLKEPVVISVTNISSKTITYGIGVLVRGDEQWEELLTNLEDHEFGRMAFKLRKLPGNKCVTLIWHPQELTKPYLIGKGMYRFYVAFTVGENDRRIFLLETAENIGHEVGKRNQQLRFSDVFELK